MWKDLVNIICIRENNFDAVVGEMSIGELEIQVGPLLVTFQWGMNLKRESDGVRAGWISVGTEGSDFARLGEGSDS